MNTDKYKERLLAEKKKLEEELGGFAQKSLSNPDDWNAVPDNTDEVATRDEVAERMEELDERKATEAPLEGSLSRVNDALDRIKDNRYGKCEICGKEIEECRLEALPAARTCIEHKEQD